ncbi:MAG: histidine--tRNA ligase [Candidatus Caldatribacteriota bacterium]|nr:histidine--tRNA ligase [Atribacterota bacterium]MDD3031068.1 histidine--tRNA ligase [Atribacterota bacterium]MDD3640650.1 histidine--tRNA ligase [Atribacterota bacterium]MDD4289299.1 histidine--tRNA ligase [Atribacterota bacterium]MDD4764936.1 histidine--tRNA ligase [Atribacterota bacterium]
MLSRAPKGTNDILPNQIDYWYYVEDIIKDVLQTYGYREIRTPAFEHTELFVRGIGETTDIVNKEMFTFQDKKGRSLTLRPEGTAPVVRAYLEHNLVRENPLVKLFYLGSMFRCEKPQAGRYRQFNQFGLEAIGSQSPLIDAEIIEASLAIYKRLGLSKLNLVINSVGCRECRPKYLSELKGYFQDKKELLCPDCRDRYDKNPLRILDCKNTQCRMQIEKSPTIFDFLCQDCQDHFQRLTEYLDVLGIAYQINPLLVRGLDYYTKTAFEIISGELGSQNAVGGGGRYDYLVRELGGKDTPAVGFAAGIERIIATMEKQKVKIPVWAGIKVFVATVSSEDIPAAFKIINNLRENGISTETDYLNKSLKAQMRLANKLNVSYVLIVGQEELAEQKITIKNMTDGHQQAVPLKEISSYISNK